MLATFMILLGVAAVDLAGAASPGPGFLAVTRIAAANGRRAGLACALGLATGSALWAAAALFGLGAVFAAAPWAQTTLRLAGAVYLMWLAAALWRRGGAAATDAPPAPVRRPFRGAVLLQMANPKTAVFFGSIFLTVLPAHPSLALACAIIATVAATEALWFAALALAFGSAPVQARYARLRGRIDRVCGALMAALGARLAWF
ncbi:MAG: threonine/homoserine/homoserine lactone efflux protein [Paracoccaceae bacterium]|jgi:threonine/homoserine/homoserine lactone efflux protein